MPNLRLLTVISSLTFVAVGITAPLIGLYLQSLGADYQQISWILTSVVATSLIASYAWGRYSDRLGRRKPLMVGGLMILAVAFLLLSRANNEYLAWASRVFEGIGSAAYATVSLAMMGDLLQNDANKGRRMGWYRGIASAAFALGSVLGGWLADYTSIAQTLVLCAGLYAVAALAALWLQEQPRATTRLPLQSGVAQEKNPEPTVHPVEGWNRGLPLIFLAGVILWVAAHTASASMWPNYMANLGYSKTVIGRLWGLAALVEFPAMGITGALSDTLGRAPLLLLGGLGIALTNLGYLFLAGWLPLLLGVQVIRGIGYGSYTGNAMTYATELGDPSNRGSRSGIFNSTMSAGSLVGTFLGGTLVQNFGFGLLYATCAALALCAAGCFLWLQRRNNAQKALVAAPAGD